jgi:hypothetical protein
VHPAETCEVDGFDRRRDHRDQIEIAHPGIEARGGQILRFQSRGEAVVFVDEPAEKVPPPNITRTDRDRVSSPGQR